MFYFTVKRPVTRLKGIGPIVATKYDELKHKESNSDYVHRHEPNDVIKATVTDTT